MVQNLYKSALRLSNEDHFFPVVSLFELHCGKSCEIVVSLSHLNCDKILNCKKLPTISTIYLPGR